ncbi:MAG: hypothetical protein LBQ98_00620 [Nitrososphaerota archaeon]|jgi:hypothetical protein|nr:hypothetical protein [Nitrososphaerota archaeon]
MKQKILISSFIVIAAISVMLVWFLYFAPATLQAEINSATIDTQQPVSLQQGESTQFTISLRNIAGFRPIAKGVYGQLDLPEGFIENSLQTQTRELAFGLILPGDAGHYGLNISAEDTVKPGSYYAKFTFWGENVQTQEIDIAINVTSN